MDIPTSVRRFLVDYEQLCRDAYEGSDFDALNVIIDGEKAIEDANLTDKQRAAIEMTFIDGYTQEEVAEKLGLAGRPSVNNLLKRALDNVAKSEGYDEEAVAEYNEAVYGRNRENFIR